MNASSAPSQTEFERRYHGLLYSLLSWDQLTAFWPNIDPAEGWYIYALGEPVPERPSTSDQVAKFIEHVDQLLRKEHHEDYCGIVYADDLVKPRLVKIYDPNNLGVSCGSSKNPPPPGWVLSLDAPTELTVVGPTPANRKRWWQNLFSR